MSFDVESEGGDVGPTEFECDWQKLMDSLPPIQWDWPGSMLNDDGTPRPVKVMAIRVPKIPTGPGNSTTLPKSEWIGPWPGDEKEEDKA